jgi:hypothetical protein
MKAATFSGLMFGFTYPELGNSELKKFFMGFVV